MKENVFERAAKPAAAFLGHVLEFSGSGFYTISQ
jgi:hypothetical protein